MDTIEAVDCVHRAHPDAAPAELAALCTEYGVPVSEALVRLALRADHWGTGPVFDPATPEPREQTAVPEPVPHDVPEPPPAETPVSEPVLDPPVESEANLEVPVPEAAPFAIQGLVLDLPDAYPVFKPVEAPPLVLAADQPRREVHARVPVEVVPVSFEKPVNLIKRRALEARETTPPPPVPSTGVPADLLARARVLDAEYRRTHDGRPASIHVLKAGLHIGQPRAYQVRDALAERSTP
jgi:hypothetical protein